VVPVAGDVHRSVAAPSIDMRALALARLRRSRRHIPVRCRDAKPHHVAPVAGDATPAEIHAEQVRKRGVIHRAKVVGQAAPHVVPARHLAVAPVASGRTGNRSQPRHLGRTQSAGVESQHRLDLALCSHVVNVGDGADVYTGMAGVVELANTPVLGAGARKSLRVRVPSPALTTRDSVSRGGYLRSVALTRWTTAPARASQMAVTPNMRMSVQESIRRLTSFAHVPCAPPTSDSIRDAARASDSSSKR
jgi:hypothetical protein